MKVLLDTSILVAALYEGHSVHDRALPWLQRVSMPGEVGLVSAHSLAETYVTLTRIPSAPPISPLVAQRLIEQRVVNNLQVVELTTQDYVNVLRHLANLRITSGAVYDALIVYAAIKGEAEQIITLNPRDFQRVYPGISSRIVLP